MAQSLNELKRLLRDRFLGQSGVHGVGIRRSDNAVCIYVDPLETPEQHDLLAEIEREARPFSVVVVREERPSLA